MGDVLQYLIDGTSGIVTGGVDGKALVAGVCSKGIVGKAYLIGKRTDLAAMLGTGPLVDHTLWPSPYRGSLGAISPACL